MSIAAAFFVLALLALCNFAESGTFNVPIAWSNLLYQRGPSGHMTNGVISNITNITTTNFIFGKDNGSKVDALDNIIKNTRNQNSTVNVTSVLANSSSKPRSRLLTETNQDTHLYYNTINCDSAAIGHENAEAFDEILAQVQRNLRLVVDQAKKGEASKYGFQALFKSSSNSQTVASVFAKIMNTGRNDDNAEQATFTPIMVCVPAPASNEPTEDLETFYNACHENPKWRAMQPWGSSLTLFCPSFWEIPGVPTARNCPKKNNLGIMQPNENTLQLNKQSIFVHEMVHIYLRNSYGKGSEVYKVADAVALSEQASLRNPSNYAFFYAGK